MELKTSTNQPENVINRKPVFESMTLSSRKDYAHRLTRQEKGHVPVVVEKHKTATFDFGGQRKMYE